MWNSSVETIGFEFCCTMNEIGGFLRDDDLEGEIRHAQDKDIDYNEQQTNLSHDAAKKQVLKEFEDEIDSTLRSQKAPYLATTNDKQKIAKALLLKKGFKVIGTYKGHEGTITVLIKGLKSPRK